MCGPHKWACNHSMLRHFVVRPRGESVLTFFKISAPFNTIQRFSVLFSTFSVFNRLICPMFCSALLTTIIIYSIKWIMNIDGNFFWIQSVLCSMSLPFQLRFFSCDSSQITQFVIFHWNRSPEISIVLVKIWQSSIEYKNTFCVENFEKYCFDYTKCGMIKSRDLPNHLFRPFVWWSVFTACVLIWSTAPSKYKIKKQW